MENKKTDGISLVWPHSKDKETTEKLQFYHNLDNNTRGAFLVQANWIESDLDTVLSFIFCGDNEEQRNLLKSTLLKKNTFDSKSQILMSLIRITRPDLIEKYEGLKGKFDSIRKFRNKLAHASLYLDDEFIKKNPKDRILIKIFEDGKEKHPEILVKDVEDRLVQASAVMMELGKLYKDLKQPPSNSS